MSCLRFDYSKIYEFLPKTFIENNEELVKVALGKLINKSAPGFDYTGWVDYASKLSTVDLEEVLEVSKEIFKFFKIKSFLLSVKPLSILFSSSSISLLIFVITSSVFKNSLTSCSFSILIPLF